MAVNSSITVTGDGSNNIFKAVRSGVTRVVIKNGVNTLGINTDTINNPLTVNGGADFSGSVGIGTTSPAVLLQVSPPTTINLVTSLFTAGNSDSNFKAGFANGSGTAVASEHAKVGMWYGTSGNPITHIGFLRGNSADSLGMTFNVNNSEYMRINSSGNVGIGTTAPATQLNVGHENHGIGFAYLGASSLPSIAGIFTSDGTAGGQTGYGSLLLKARSDYAPFYSINFFTATSANTPVERMRITAGGNVGIGTTAPQSRLQLNIIGSTLGLTGDAALRIAGGTFTTDQIVFGYSETGGYSPAVFGYIAQTATGYQFGDLFFATRSVTTNTAPTERMRITSDGQVLIGMTSNTGVSTTSIRAGLFSGQRDNAIDPVFQAWNQGTSLDNQFVHFYTEGGSGTFRGSIDFNRGAGLVRYNTSSDYRLKSEIEDFNASEIILNLKPKKYRIGDAEQKTIGFIAHELQEYYPQAVSGTKDQVNQNGDPIYQGVDYSQLTGLLVKAIQEQQSQIETLKSKIEILEQS
jgi:hypothetical protein